MYSKKWIICFVLVSLYTYGFLSGCYPEPPVNPPSKPMDCSGQYWIDANASIAQLAINSPVNGSFTGTISDNNGNVMNITGSCPEVKPGDTGKINFIKTVDANSNDNQTYDGTYQKDLESKQITIKGTFMSNSTSYLFNAFTILDDSKIKIQDPTDLTNMRDSLISFLWEKQGFPFNKMPDHIQTNVTSPVAELDDVLLSVDQFDITMEEGFVSFAFHFHPKNPSHRLMIFHHGHSSDLGSDGGYESIHYFLQAGYDVLAFYMLTFGPNTEPVEDHFHIIALDPTTRPYNPMKFFLEPIASGLNYDLKQNHFEVIAMMGISGGGWSTTLYSALDSRIQYSFPVAGSLPLYLRTQFRDIGDAEQYYPDFYRIAGYPDLYVLGASGHGRKQIQILNQYDACCFAVSTTPDYVSRVADQVFSLGMGGSYDLKIDMGQTQHTISTWTIQQVIAPAIGP